MFSIHYCCCCLGTEILLSIETKSSYEDGKTLLDYLNFMFGTFLKEQPTSEFICEKCSQALQVAYHFIIMVNKSKEFNRNVQTNQIQESFEYSSAKEIVDNNVQEEQITPSNRLANENQLKLQPTDNGFTLNDVPSFQLTDNFKIILSGLNKDTNSSLIGNNYNLDFICSICNITFNDKISYVKHNKQEHKEITPYKCKLCSYSTCYMESLLKHCDKKHGLNNVDLNLYQLKREATIIPDNCPDFEVGYLCSVCNFKDCNQTVTIEHLLDEHAIGDNRELFVKNCFSCPVCQRSFMTLKSAKIHFSMLHICSLKKSNECTRRPFCCEKCGKLFDLKSSLVLHRRICEERKIVNCNFCSLEITSVLKYEQHLQATHFITITYQCETCDKTFSCSKYLAVHRKRHNERNYQCDLCAKNYITNAELKVHKKRNHELKHAAITCDICKKKFANLTLLKYHENRMHKAPLLQYNSCEFVSNSSSAPKIHQSNHIDKSYECHVCKKEFLFRDHLGQHLKNHHSNFLNNDDMTYGYTTSRYGAFSDDNNSLDIA